MEVFIEDLIILLGLVSKGFIWLAIGMVLATVLIASRPKGEEQEEQQALPPPRNELSDSKRELSDSKKELPATKQVKWK